MRDVGAGGEGRKEIGAGNRDLLPRREIVFQSSAQRLILRGDLVFERVELGVLKNLPPLATQHAVRGRGRLPVSSVGIGRRNHSGCGSGLFIGGRSLVVGTVVVGAYGAAREQNKHEKRG